MLSRRNVRIKVMQVLYAAGKVQDMDYGSVMHLYRKGISRSFELLLFNLDAMIRIAGFARQDASKKTAKLRPTDEDRLFTAKLYDNSLMASLSENPELKRLIRAYHLDDKIDEDNVRLIYADFAKSEEYKSYVLKKDTNEEDHMEMLLFLYKHCCADETFNELVEDHYPAWIDDKSLIVGSMKKILKALPAEADFYDAYRPPEEAVKEFGELLVDKSFHTDDELLEIIEPALKNWDAERVAVIDMILIKMALCEMMYFPSIPTKVTLNEYVEISKLYSTDKSKDFINGILDRLMKKLQKDGKIVKEGRGLIE